MQQSIKVRIENLKRIKKWLNKKLKKGLKWLKKKKLGKKIVSSVKRHRPLQILIIILLILLIALYTSSHSGLREKANKQQELLQKQSESLELQENIVDEVETDLDVKAKKLKKAETDLQKLKREKAEKDAEIERLQAELQAKLDRQVTLASVNTYTPVQYVPTISYGNNYAWGNCTFYVANRTSVPASLGNANAWEWNLPQYGYRQVQAQVGAIVVFQAGEEGASWLGHVAYVESLNGDGSVNISEMNVAGLGIVSYRTLPAYNSGSYFVR